MGLRLRCDWGNPFACALFATAGPGRRALAAVLIGLTVSHYSWSLTSQQFEVCLGFHALDCRRTPVWPKRIVFSCIKLVVQKPDGWPYVCTSATCDSSPVIRWHAAQAGK